MAIQGHQIVQKDRVEAPTKRQEVEEIFGKMLNHQVGAYKRS
jgi:hypothetical protein